MSAADAKALAADPTVDYVEQDHTVQMSDDQLNPPSWGLDRIDQESLPLNQRYTYPNTASNVRAYIIDTGIRMTHSTFGGRATSGRDTVDNDNDATDCQGHGTHVAGTVGGSQYGVAKGVRLVGVRVLNCQGSGTNAGVIAGVDWTTANAVKPAVANMSLGGGANTALDNAVANSIASGITYAVAAGNGDIFGRPANACTVLPGPGARRDHRRRHPEQRRLGELLELRHLPGHLGAGRRDHLVLDDQRHRHEHDQRHVDGLPARGRRGGGLPVQQPDQHAAAGPGRAGERGLQRQGHQPRHRLAEQAAARHRRHRRTRPDADPHADPDPDSDADPGRFVLRERHRQSASPTTAPSQQLLRSPAPATPPPRSRSAWTSSTPTAATWSST